MGSDLSSPKVRPKDRVGVDGWVHFHAAYNKSFAKAVLAQLLSEDGGTVADPFCGSGTTARAAAEIGVRSVSVDLNPALLALARASVLRAAAAETVIETLEGTRKHRSSATQDIGDLESQWLHPATARELARIREELRAVNGNNAKAFANGLLVATARDLVRPAMGSNPTWPKPPRRRRKRDVRALLLSRAQRMLADLKAAEDSRSEFRHAFRTGDAKRLPLDSNSVDAILTSPPYLSRIDYVRATLPELIAIGIGDSLEIKQLRSEIMGGVIAGTTEGPTLEWLPKTRTALDAIWNHGSKASRGYYTTLARRYFSDLDASAAEMARVLAPGARGVIVVQNSYYKDVQVKVPDILMEMLEQHGLSTKTLHSVRVAQHLGRLSPVQRAYVRDKNLEEVAILAIK